MCVSIAKHFLLIFCTAESQIQNKSTLVMGAVFGIMVILLVVVAVLLLRRRLVTSYMLSVDAPGVRLCCLMSWFVGSGRVYL